MLVQSATSSNFQPRAPLGSRRQSPPRPPRVGARGGPVCRGQVRGSCPPGATRPSTRGRCRRGESRGRSIVCDWSVARARLGNTLALARRAVSRPWPVEGHAPVRYSSSAFLTFVSRGSRFLQPPTTADSAASRPRKPSDSVCVERSQ